MNQNTTTVRENMSYSVNSSLDSSSDDDSSSSSYSIIQEDSLQIQSHYYTGNLQNENREGEGILIEQYALEVYKGQFKNNLKNGPGVLYFDLSNFIFSFGGEFKIEGTQPTNKFSISKYDIFHKKWCDYQMKPFTFNRCLFPVICFDTFIYIIGGYDGSKTIDSIERYDFISKTWEDMSSLKIRRSACDSILYIEKKQILIFGGIKNNTALYEIEAYDIQLNESKIIGKLKIPRVNCKVARFENKIFIFGGTNSNVMDSNIFVNIEYFDLETYESFLLPLHFNYMSFGLFQINDDVYLTGGANSNQPKEVTTNFWKFNLKFQTLTSLPNLNKKREYHSLTYYDNKLLVFGGYDQNNIVQEVEAFDFMINKWNIIDKTFLYSGASSITINHMNSILISSTWKDDKINDDNTTISLYLKNQENFMASGKIKNNKREGNFIYKYFSRENILTNETNIIFKENIPISEKLIRFEENVARLSLDNKIPEWFLCPISLQVMLKPVVISSGKTYDEKSIKKWLKKKNIDPQTKEIVQDKNMFLNHLALTQIREFFESNKIEFPNI